MTIHELQTEIIRLKQEKNVCILAHAYQGEEIWEVADFIGDSYGLSKQAAAAEAKTVIMCGVRFMAETVKILSPEKQVLLANPIAGCPMADQMDRDLVAQMREMLPDYAVVAYINTTAATKTVCDVCVTSSSAVKIMQNLPQKKVIFIPDCNLGDWIAKKVPDKEIKLVSGGCPTHLRITPKDVEKMRALHPEAKLLVHPECHPSVTAQADFVGSTTQIMDYAMNGDDKEYIIGTENSIVKHLQYRCMDKMFYPLSKDCVCHNMAATTLMDIYNCLTDRGGEEIVLTDEEMSGARRCLDEMLRLGK